METTPGTQFLNFLMVTALLSPLFVRCTNNQTIFLLLNQISYRFAFHLWSSYENAVYKLLAPAHRHAKEQLCQCHSLCFYPKLAKSTPELYMQEHTATAMSSCALATSKWLPPTQSVKNIFQHLSHLKERPRRDEPGWTSATSLDPREGS